MTDEDYVAELRSYGMLSTNQAADRIEQLTAERDRLREAAIALRDDMLERSRAGMDVIHGEQYRIVNAGAGVWMDFCAALKGETP